jgi:hypothetical protein
MFGQWKRVAGFGAMIEESCKPEGKFAAISDIVL